MHGDQPVLYTQNSNSMDNIPLMPFHSRSSPSRSLSASHPKTISEAQSSRLSLDEEQFDYDQHIPRSSNFQTPNRPQLSYQRPTTSRKDILFKGIWQLTKTFLVPFITIAYLSFCYAVHYKVVSFDGKGLYNELNDTLLVIIKSGLTTISIVIVSISLYPVRDLLSSLKSEEFFRVLHRRPQVPLSAINAISNPSCGIIETILLIIHNNCSPFFVTAFIAAGIVWVASAIAPAALSIQTVLADGDIQAFSVGAIPPLSFYSPVASRQTISPMQLAVSPGYPASIAWAEMALGMSYAYTMSNKSLGEYAAYVTPMPISIQASTTARWLTDVVGFNPYCTWANPMNLTKSSSSKAMNSTSVAANAVTVYLEGLDLDIAVPSSIFPVYKSKFVTTIQVLDPSTYVFNHTTSKTLPSDGSTTFAIVACTEGCTGDQLNIISIYPDLTDIPTLKFTAPNNTYELSFLVCKPNITIETREVRTQGSLILEVQPLPEGKSYRRQGNLDLMQTSFMLGVATSYLSVDSGPQTSTWYGLGSETQVNFMFSRAQMNAIDQSTIGVTTKLQPIPLENLTQGYTQIVQAAAKAYITGSEGTAYVPGRVSSMQLIFTSSLPNVIMSTVAFALLWALTIFAHFRKGKSYDFTLVNVGAALHNSEIPKQFSQMKAHAANDKIPRSRWVHHSADQDVVEMLGAHDIALLRSRGLDSLRII